MGIKCIQGKGSLKSFVEVFRSLRQSPCEAEKLGCLLQSDKVFDEAQRQSKSQMEYYCLIYAKI